MTDKIAKSDKTDLIAQDRCNNSEGGGVRCSAATQGLRELPQQVVVLLMVDSIVLMVDIMVMLMVALQIVDLLMVLIKMYNMVVLMMHIMVMLMVSILVVPTTVYTNINTNTNTYMVEMIFPRS